LKFPTLTEFVNFIFPPECLHCGEILTENNNPFICKNCFGSIKTTTKQLLNAEKKRKFTGEGLISDFYSHFLFEKEGPLQSLIHQLKYNNKFKIGIFLGQYIANEASDLIKNWGCDFIIPIPLHPIKKAERGYNQSKQIAKGISQIVNINVKSNVLKRTRFTQTQTKLNLMERRNNVKNIFKANPKIVKNKNLLLVDDVITTGSTLSSAAKTLKNKGANKIYAISIALAKLTDDI